MRDRPKFEHAVRVFTDPDLKLLTREQLEERRNLLHVQLAAVNEHLQRHDRARAARIRADYEREDALEAADAARRQARGSIDPSDT